MPTKISPQPVSHRSQSLAESNQPKSDPNLARHARKCAICNHADREFIEEDFVAWRSEAFICRVYTLPSPSSIYRHASATGLLTRRRRNLRGVAERILENVNGVTVTASAVIRAMRLFASITEDGQWAEPPKRSIVTHIHVTQHPSANHPAVDDPPAADRTSLTVEHPTTCPSDSPVETVASSATEHPADRQQHEKTPRRLDYLPRWAAGLPDAEILIGVENSSPGDSND